ncbi:MAG: MoxR family ATPase [Acidobacteria bacterium]|nr:MoxR family ATPase [Acidobacteriota bacterium]
MLQYVPATVEHIRAELRKVIVGQDEVIEQVLVALLAEGHALLEGVPGTAKTLLVKTLARIVGADFSRIQFTPDLMPSDITGTNVFNVATASFSLRRGPVPLPEAQLDRFLLKIIIGYPSPDEETRIVSNWDEGFNARRLNQVDIQSLAEPDEVARCRAEVRATRMEPGVQRYLVEIVRRTREHPSVAYGASPRASVALLLCSKALATMRGRDFSTPDDVRDIARPVLRHRISLRAEAELDGATADSVVNDILSTVEVPR